MHFLTAEEMRAQNGKLITTDLGEYPKMHSDNLRTERSKWKWRRTWLYKPAMPLFLLASFALLITWLIRKMPNLFTDYVDCMTSPFLLGSITTFGIWFGLMFWGASIDNKIGSINSVLRIRNLPPGYVPMRSDYEPV